jgi:hypothetical protein
MLRVFVAVALIAAAFLIGLGVSERYGGTFAAGGIGLSSTMTGAVGLVCGAVLVWLSRVNWSMVLATARVWMRVQRRRAVHLTVACFAAGVLLFY